MDTETAYVKKECDNAISYLYDLGYDDDFAKMKVERAKLLIAMAQLEMLERIAVAVEAHPA